MATKWDDLKHKAPPEKRARIKQQALDELAVVERAGVGFIRAARHQTQVTVAEQMNIPQSAVSRLEAQTDCRLSTLRRYVAALGGHLEMRAVFPDDTLDLNELMDQPTEQRA